MRHLFKNFGTQATTMKHALLGLLQRQFHEMQVVLLYGSLLPPQTQKADSPYPCKVLCPHTDSTPLNILKEELVDGWGC